MTETGTRAKPRIDDPKELGRLVKQIVEKVDPVAIYLFGSRARGDADEDSDYDLMIVVRDNFKSELGKSTADLAAPDRRIPATILKTHQSSFEWRRHQVGTLEYDTVVDGLVLYEQEDTRLRSCRPPGSFEDSCMRVVHEWLDRADWHLPAVECCLPEIPDRAVHHLQQSAEKLTKAVLVAHSVRPHKGHKIGEFARLLPDGFPMRDRFFALDQLSDYVWAYQYPVAAGTELPPEPTAEDAERWLAEVKALKADFEHWPAAREATP
jgi:uncharacterized protein